MLLDMPQSVTLGHSQDRVLCTEGLEIIDLWALLRRRRLLKALEAQGMAI